MQVYRLFDNYTNKAIADVVTEHDEEIDSTKPYEIFHPLFTWKRKTIKNFYTKKFLVKIFDKGKQVYESPNINKIREYCKDELDTLWDEVTRFENPHEYFVDLSQSIWDVKSKLLKENQ